VDKKATFPLRIGVNALYCTPQSELAVGDLLSIKLLGQRRNGGSEGGSFTITESGDGNTTVSAQLDSDTEHSNDACEGQTTDALPKGAVPEAVPESSEAA